jgi:hypothetical protein
MNVQKPQICWKMDKTLSLLCGDISVSILNFFALKHTLWREVSVVWRKVGSDVFIKKLLEEMQLKLNNIVSDGFTCVN